MRLYGADDVEDLSQETWLRMVPYQAANDVRHPKALLLRIAANLAADRFGRRAKRGRLAEEVGKLDGWGMELPAQTDAVLARQLVLGLPQPLRDVASVIECYLALSAGRAVHSSRQCLAGTSP